MHNSIDRHVNSRHTDSRKKSDTGRFDFVMTLFTSISLMTILVLLFTLSLSLPYFHNLDKFEFVDTLCDFIRIVF